MERVESFIYSTVFKGAYLKSVEAGRKRNQYLEKALATPSIKLEQTLKDFVNDVMGFRFGSRNLGEVRVHFDNIIYNLPEETDKSLIELINEYKMHYLDILNEYPYVKILIEVFKRYFSRSYDGKLYSEETLSPFGDFPEALIKHDIKANAIIIDKSQRQTDVVLPSVVIKDLAKVNESVKRFIEAVKNSQTDYNIFSSYGHSVYTDEEKVKMVLEGILLNATIFDLKNLALYFDRYTEFVVDDKLGNLPGLYKMGEAFDDELYFKVRKSDFEYETPYFLSFMLKNHIVELPNIRVGINNDENRAYIVAVQTSQRTGNNEEINDTVKKNLKRTRDYNYSNPTHMASLMLAFGLLKGMGVSEIDIVDHMPLRYYKTTKDKNMNEQEANAYLARVTRKNINGFLKLECLTQGVDIACNASISNNMTVLIDDEVVCHNEFFQNLYDMGYNLGQSFDFPDRGTR